LASVNPLRDAAGGIRIALLTTGTGPMPSKKETQDKDTHGHAPLTEDEIKAIAERRAESLKRIQEQNAKNATKHFGDDHRGGGGKGKSGPAKGRIFRHQGR
jgi:hypothetical protein